MSTFLQIKEKLRDNLDDVGVRQFSDANLTDSLKDAYHDITSYTGCIIKRQNAISFESGLIYYNFRDTIDDFLGVLAIFNNGTNLWLDDSINLKQMDQLQEDWELWTGAPRWWIPASPLLIALVPKYVDATGLTFDLIYSATAPTFVDADSPLVAVDMEDLFENYVTADALEQNEDFTKAAEYWEDYYTKGETYRERVRRLAKADLLLLG